MRKRRCFPLPLRRAGAREREARRAACAVCAALLLAACTTQSIAPQPTGLEGFASWTDTTPAYQFAPGDKVRVRYLMTPEMDEDAVVAPDGVLALRAAGRVHAAGLTPEQLDGVVATASRRILSHPVVTTSDEDPQTASVYVGGSVKKGGVYPITGRRGTLEAVLMAGGFDNEARMDEVVLIRRNPQNRPMLRTVNLQSYVDHGTVVGDVPLYPGDVVFVPRNRISEFGLWVDSVLNKAIPFNKAFSYTINRNSPASLY